MTQMGADFYHQGTKDFKKVLIRLSLRLRLYIWNLRGKI